MLTVVMLVLVWTAACALLLSTPTGLQVLRVASERASHGALVIDQIHGSVLGGFVAEGVQWEGPDGVHLRLARLQLAWHPAALLHGTVRVGRLELDGLHVVTVARKNRPQSSIKSLRIPAGLPLNLRIDALVVKDLRVGDGTGKPFVVPAARLAASWIGRTLDIRSLDATTAATGPVHLSAQARTTADALDISQLRLTGPGQIDVMGRLGYGTAPSKLKLSLQGLKWPLVGKHAGQTVRDLQGSVILGGTLRQYHVQTRLSGEARGRKLQVKLRGNGTPKDVKVTTLHVEVDHNGSISGHGHVRFRPQLAADLDLAVSHFNPAPLAPDFPGNINGRVRLKTTAAARTGASTIHFGAHLAHSQLRKQPLAVAAVGVAELLNNKWRINVDHLSASLGATQLSVAGRVTPPFAVHGKLKSADLSAVDPQLAGRLQADFKFSGTLEKPILDTRGHAADLKLGDRYLGRAQWDVQLDVPGRSTLTATLENAQFGTTTISRAQFRGGGTTADHQLHVTLESPQADVTASLAGGYDLRARRWSGQLTALTFTPKVAKGLRAWHLAQASKLVIARRQVDLAPACLSDGTGRVCLQATQTGTSTQAAFTLSDVQLAGFKALLPRQLKVEGALDGKGHLLWRGAQLTAQAQLRMASGRVSVADAPPIDILQSHARVQIGGESGIDGVDAELQLRTRHGYATAKVHVAGTAGEPLTQAPLSGTVSLAIPDIAFLQPVAAGKVTHLSGAVDGKLALAGTLRMPRIAGHLKLGDGRLTLPTAGVTFSAVSLALTGKNDAPIQLSGAATSGGGTLKLSGTLDTRHWPVTVDLHVKGQDVEVFSTPDARIWVSPDLQLVRGADGLDLQGSILVPHAELTPRGGIGAGHGGVAVSPDQVIVGAPPKKKVPEPRVNIQLALILGDQVNFDGFGLKTRIAGGVVVTQKPSSPALARGQFYLIDGHYKAYGQDLTIKTGRLIFDGGPVTKPAIDIVAVRKPRADIQVGVQVRGTLDKPKLTLTSSPAMPQQQQLSWLLFGHPLDQGSSGDQSAIAAATLSLALGGGDYLANRIGKHLGIDEVSIGTPSGGGSAVATNADTINGSMAAMGYGAEDASQAAQLTIGKYLTPRLYVSYGVSLFRPGQVFRLLYNLGHGFKLQTESGVSNGGDLLYTFEAGD